MKLFRLPIQPPCDRTKHYLENTISRKTTAIRISKRHSINDITQIVLPSNLRELIVKHLQMLRSLGVSADLEELDTDLPRGSIEVVELLRGLDERVLVVVRGNAVGDADNVHGLRRVRSGGVGDQVVFEEFVQSSASRSGAAGADSLKDFADSGRVCDVHVVVGMVEEVDVNAIGVVRCADWGDGHQCVRGLAPEAAGHGSGVIDEEHCVEFVEESVCVVGYRCRVGAGRTGYCCRIWRRGICWRSIERRCAVKWVGRERS
jgi:hypothetical protein